MREPDHVRERRRGAQVSELLDELLGPELTIEILEAMVTSLKGAIDLEGRVELGDINAIVDRTVMPEGLDVDVRAEVARLLKAATLRFLEAVRRG